MEGKNNNTGIGVIGVIQIIFIVLKMTGLINWSWWAVFSPTLIALGLCLIIFVVACAIAVKKLKG